MPFLFLLAPIPFFCYNSHLLFLSRAVISHVAVSRQLQAHIHMLPKRKKKKKKLHIFLHMLRYGSHQVKVKGRAHYPAPVKTFRCVLCSGITKEGEVNQKRKKGGYGLENLKKDILMQEVNKMRLKGKLDAQNSCMLVWADNQTIALLPLVPHLTCL